MTDKRNYIRYCFIDINEFKYNGVFSNGIGGDGEFKRWHNNGKLFAHRFYKNYKLNGEYKRWKRNGDLTAHRRYRDNEVVKDYLK